MKLDIGCGNFPRGDINIDLFPEKGMYRTWKEKLRVKDISNFVRADAHYLPFKDNSFNLVSSYQVLCHVRNPSEVLAEMIRVANGKIVATVPFFLFNTITMIFSGRKKGRHEQWFTPEWFKAKLKNSSIRFKVHFVWLKPKYLWIKFPWIDMTIFAECTKMRSEN